MHVKDLMLKWKPRELMHVVKRERERETCERALTFGNRDFLEMSHTYPD